MGRDMTTIFDEPTRDPLDFNRTPAWCVELLIPELGQPRTILDAGCGDGAIGRVLKATFPHSWLVGIELDRARRNGALDVHTGRQCAYDCVDGMDWLGDTGDDLRDWTDVGVYRSAPDLIISNPPFGLAAIDFLKCAIARVRPGGTVAFLLPTHWDHDPDESCGEPLPAPKKGKPAPRHSEEAIERSKHKKNARQRFLDSIRLPDGREGYAKLAIVGGGKNPCRPAFRGGSSTATDRYAWFMFGEPWAGQPSRRLHAIPKEETSTQLEIGT
jgi:hypothetical protein